MSTFLDSAVEIARQAGNLIQEYAAKNIGYEFKGEQDLVTEADRSSEALIIEYLQSHFPDHAIVAEESGEHLGTADYCWYVDPLDGTTNFAHGFPVYNVTLALEHKGELIAGVIHDPTRGETFTAERGSGAFLNGKRISVSKTAELSRALSATGFPSRKRHKSINVHFFYQTSIRSQGVRRAGSAAIDLAYVSCGRLDLFWEFRLNPWDIAAGVLILQEAGGKITDMHGAPIQLRGPHVLATNGQLHPEAVDLFADIFAGRYRQALPELPGDPTA